VGGGQDLNQEKTHAQCFISPRRSLHQNPKGKFTLEARRERPGDMENWKQWMNTGKKNAGKTDCDKKAKEPTVKSESREKKRGRIWLAGDLAPPPQKKHHMDGQENLSGSKF